MHKIIFLQMIGYEEYTQTEMDVYPIILLMFC